jgi:hypothetical protein
MLTISSIPALAAILSRECPANAGHRRTRTTKAMTVHATIAPRKTGPVNDMGSTAGHRLEMTPPTHRGDRTRAGVIRLMRRYP